MDLSTHFRALPHWLWLGVVGFTGAYAQLHAGRPVWTDAARFGVLPLLQASGVLGWFKARAAHLAQPLRACPLRALIA
jgi:hypothetical protein